jgi:beta-galactosidase
MRLGLPYYFEQWPRDRWAPDADLMREAGVSVVRMGEFAWSELEPEEGRYDFSLLESAMDEFAARGMSFILGTPTASYPPWLHARHPDLHQMRPDGTAKEHGQRQDACKNHPAYRRAALGMSRAMAARFGSDPRVLAWQIDNELGNHGTESCWCPRCEEAFRAWLSSRFSGDIGALNAAWGTAFWSHRYGYFSEVDLPRDSSDRTWRMGQNPGLLLDFARFSSDVQVAFLAEQEAILRELAPGKIVTHNFMSGYFGIDGPDLARRIDVVSWDNYPFLELEGRSEIPSGLNHAYMRGLKRKNAWVMEQATGAGGLDRAWPEPEPGRMRLWAFQSVARGADLIVFYRWRSARFGQEQLWHGILSHDGRHGRRLDEFLRFASEIGRLGPALELSAPESKVALLLDTDSVWSLGFQPIAREGTDPRWMAASWCRFLDSRGISYDCVFDASGLEAYEVVAAPCLSICPEETARSLSSFVERGGLLVLGPLCGTRDAENAMLEEPAPGPLARIAGCRVEEIDAFSYAAGAKVGVITAAGGIVPAFGLAELLDPDEGTETTARFSGRYYTGRSAVCLSRRGAGECLYLGAAFGAEGLEALVAPLLERRDLAGFPLPEGVESARRVGPGGAIRFLLNHGELARTVTLERAGRDLLTGRELEGSVELEPLDVVALEEEPPSGAAARPPESGRR